MVAIAAEQIVVRNPRHTVIRTSLNAGVSPAGDRAFNEEVRRACVCELRRCLEVFSIVGARWMNLHPDRHAHASDAERRAVER